jgi:hypothetical protein
MRLCGILLSSFCLLYDSRLLGSYSKCCIYICKHSDKHFADDGQGKMDMEGNINEWWGGKGHLFFGNGVDGSAGTRRRGGKSGSTGGAEQDRLNAAASAELVAECKVLQKLVWVGYGETDERRKELKVFEWNWKNEETQ